MWGIDVSHHQGVISWPQVKQNGIQFVIMKAMYESSHQPDGRFEYNYTQSGNQLLERGVYLYMTAKTEAAARTEATDMLRILHGRVLERGVWLDVEDTSIKSLGKDNLAHLIDIETDVLRSGGYNVGIYTNLDWYLHVLDGKTLNRTYDWWMARYPRNDCGSIKIVLKPDDDIDIWQYSSKGTVAGIKGPVDMNFDVSDLGKTNDQIASEVLVGKWGNGQIRKDRITAAGYDFVAIQEIVTQRIHDSKYYPRHKGLSFKIDEVFREIGVEPEYIGNKFNRLPIAKANDITDYNGTLVQNLKLIALAKNGDLKRP